ncbi:hypothetical protein TVAG_197830 [Trichomonas vaginalis G3]|uniref:Tubby C-terminal domain-containing protein n=1 Tax=Trichomonas vaginalis (strain ATCC PRA-98 / G3) TaxID=412133 RepID=A2EJK0_TRIV3|nr:hypothetical protein TVAGG3_0617450 [Trichomonas vaginalis G3]EAY07170.1 hypothetical protein TVAG_197830 [Trichomonas vaginalis G3]KAI5503647.1 hypothetical protein TVAGG3_0617450 [Trichomonas vaginalis G3]|eukprot:XP_001319393.1 hypothetical protein [Trichomonas vaginalis G3]
MTSDDTSENSSGLVFDHMSGDGGNCENKTTSKEFNINEKRDPRFFPPIDTSKIRSNMYSRFITYRFTQTDEIGWKGKRFHFQLSYDGDPLFHTKTKSRRPTSSVPISSGSDMHFSQKQFAAYLLVTDSNQLFSLRKDEEFGSEIMTVEFRQESKSTPRETVVNMFEKVEFVPRKLVSLKPKLSNTGRWELSFLNREIIPSIKNCILVNQDDSIPYIMVRRVCKSTLEIDVPSIYPPICVFGLALSVWLS